LNLTSGQFQINSGAILSPKLSNLFSVGEPGYGSSIYIPVLGDRFRIVTATGGISGRFTTLTQPAELTSGTQFIALYNVNNGNSLDLALAPTSYSTTLSSGTTNAKAVAGVLDQLLGVNKAGTASSAQDSLLYAVAGQSAASLPDFARLLAGEIHAASAATLAGCALNRPEARATAASVVESKGDVARLSIELELSNTGKDEVELVEYDYTVTLADGARYGGKWAAPSLPSAKACFTAPTASFAENIARNTPLEKMGSMNPAASPTRTTRGDQSRRLR
jgi:hypothetical protein